MALGPLLALDLATNMGVCEGVPGERPRLSDHRLRPPKTPYVEVHDALFDFLWDRFSAFPPAHVVIEAPMIRQRNGEDQAMLLIGMVITAQRVCRLKGVPIPRVIKPSTVRAGFLGGRQFLYQGRTIHGGGALPSDVAKFCVMERCRQLGLSPKNYDQSDAAALWFHRATQLKPALAAEMAPLFEGRAA